MEPRKTTSGLMFTYFNRSAYHESCIPSEKRQQVEVTPNTKETEFSKCDHVTQDSIWKQSVDTEKRCLKNWETNWGFLTEFDAQGNHKEPVPLPEKVVVFSNAVPNTNSGNYGNRVGTQLGQTMAQMEYQFYSGGRRKKLGNNMICY